MSPEFKHQRKLINYLLQPFVQLRIGVFSIVTALLFVFGLGTHVYLKLNQFADVVVTLTQADDEIHRLLSDYLVTVGWTAAGGAVLFILVNLVTTVYFTHKMVGPTVAFRRHIKAIMSGNFDAKVVLRKGDAFGEVAQDLNSLADWVKSKVGKTR